MVIKSVSFKRVSSLIKKIMFIAVSVLLLIAVIGYFVLQQDVFGGTPSGDRLEAIKRSKNFREGKFQTISPTPQLTEGFSYPRVLFNFFFGKTVDRIPEKEIPTISTDLKSLNKDSSLLVWFGHSSYLLQLDGKTILVDPVLSGNAGPFSWMNKAFPGSDKYKVEHLPYIDYLVITHDHFDHLDYETVKALKSSVGKVICGLGVGAHFEKWGYPPSQLVEKDWYDEVELSDSIKLHLTPARHYLGRGLSRNNTLWTSYVVVTPSKKIFIGSDSGYDKHFAEIGKRFGEFDLVMLENGQYNEGWRYIHTLPDEVLQAGKDLNAKRVFPVHSGKFALGSHPWYEPLTKVTELDKTYNQNIITPMIGEVVNLDNESQVFKKWWQAAE